MPGAKGKSGGQRSGAGRPVKRRTLKAGDTFAVSRIYADGYEMAKIWKVKEVSRTLIVIDDGEDGEVRMVS